MGYMPSSARAGTNVMVMIEMMRSFGIDICMLKVRIERCQMTLADWPWQLVIGHWSLVIGHWSLVIGHWSLVIGHWPLIELVFAAAS